MAAIPVVQGSTVIPVVQGTIVSTQPGAVQSVQSIQQQVHSLLRNGLQSVPADLALQYAATLTPEQASPSYAPARGYHKCVSKQACCKFFCPVDGCVGAYFCGCCNDRCLCFPCCTCGIALPLYSCLCCSCERDGNTWVTRDKHGNRTGQIILLDHERGTLAFYGVKCCTTQLQTEPQCYCVKSGASADDGMGVHQIQVPPVQNQPSLSPQYKV